MFIRLLVVGALGLVALGVSTDASAPAVPSSERAIIHALNRLTFGPRPGDVARVNAMGLDAWIDRQLHPSRIDDGGMSERLARLSTLSLDSEVLAREIHQPARRERQRLQRERSSSPGNPEVRRGGSSAFARSAPADRRSLGGGWLDPPATPDSPDSLPARPPINDIIRRDQQIITDLSEAKVLRAVYSERQLEEVLVDFWFNHFNVFAGKGPTRVWIGEFERDAIRPHVLGNFRTMLEAVAKSPAMLFYLDNWMNVDPDAVGRTDVRLRAPDRPRASARPGREQTLRPGRQATGLNENYARELMELHTLGVDGGYTQQDVVDVARAFTGWGLRLAGPMAAIGPARSGQGPRRGLQGFYFDSDRHDHAEKTVLGHTIKAGGNIEDGQQVLDILAAHPSTARFIAEKLARRFVSDEPPADLVKRAAAKFSATRGDLRETLRVIITSPEFFAPEASRAKVKTPFEFIVSALRATGGEVGVALPMVRELRELGMPLYLCQPPTGYDDTVATWVSSGALVNRMNFALALGSGRLRGVTLPFESTAPLASIRESLLAGALAGSASTATVATIEKATTVEQTVALALGSPEFQRK